MVAATLTVATASQDNTIVFEGPARIRPIANGDGLSRYMEVLRRAAYEAGVIKAKLNADIADLTRQARNTLLQISDANGSPISYSLGKYLRDLTSAIEEYAIGMDPETVENGDGRVARRTSPDSMSFIPRSNNDDGPATAKDGEKASIAGVLSKIGTALGKVLKPLKLDRFWKIEIKPDLTAAKKSLERGECTPEELAEQGMQLVPGGKRIDIGTADFKSGELADIRKLFE